MRSIQIGMFLGVVVGATGCDVVDHLASPGDLPAPSLGRVEQAVTSTYVSNPNRGPVIAQPNVIAVMWTGDVDPAVRDGIGGFYSTLLSSDYMTWLAEYDIQHGTYGGVYTISPSNQNPTLDRVEIRAELEARIAAGDLPPRQDNTVYAVHFPRDYTLTVALASGNKRSCDDFCGFHDSFRPQGTADPIRYTAVADQNCSRCIVGSSLFDAATVVSSHEIAEAVTNPDPDLSSSWKVRAAPGTVDPKNDLEIADLCQRTNQQLIAPVTQIATLGPYQVQKSWSNAQGNCTAGPNPHAMLGSFEAIDSHGFATGWACDPDSPQSPVTVSFFINNANDRADVTGGSMLTGGTLLVQTTASLPSEPMINNDCGGSSHRFGVQLPLTTTGQIIWAGAVDQGNGSSYLIGPARLLQPSQLTVSVANGTTWYFSDPTPVNVPRDEDIVIRNTGTGDLNLFNVSSMVSGTCIRQIRSPQPIVPPGGMTTLGVRLACSSNGISRAFVRIVSNSAPVPSVPAPGPDPTLFSFTLQGQTNPGGPHDVRLVATYVPCPLGSQTQRCPFDAPRGSFETRQAQQDSPINFHYDTNRGNFEQRPSGACDNFSNNPTYFKISMRSDVGISSCRYQASWDRAELACPPAAVDLFNQATEITLNTDDRAIDPRTCAQFRDPVVTILPIEQEGYIRLLFDIGGATYVRRLNFINHR